MFVRLNGRVTWVGHSVLSENLAERLVRVSLLADGGSLEVKVEDVDGVDILGSKLWAVDVLEESSCLIDGGNES